jgi:hypothetical protein
VIHDTKNVGKPTVLTCRFPTFYGCLLHKPSISDNTRFKLIKDGLDKSYSQTKRSALNQYQIGIYYYNNPHRLIDDEAPGFTIAVPN